MLFLVVGQNITPLSLCASELTGTGEGGGKAGVGGGGGGGADYVVSSKWARDPDINLKIRSDLHTSPLPPNHVFPLTSSHTLLLSHGVYALLCALCSITPYYIQNLLYTPMFELM